MSPDPQKLARITDPTIELIRTFPRRLSVQLERERRGGSAVPDGYPTGGSGGPGGDVTLTSVEGAVFARDGRWADDEHRRLTYAARNALDVLYAEARKVDAWLAKMEQAATVANPADEADWCTHHVRHQLFEPVMEGSQWCHWCDGLNRQYGSLPPKALLVRRQGGERLTEQNIEAAYGVLRNKAQRDRDRRRAA